MIFHINQDISYLRQRIAELSRRLADPKKKVDDQRLRVDDQTYRLQLAARNYLRRQRDTLVKNNHKLYYNNPSRYIDTLKRKLEILKDRFAHAAASQAQARRYRLREISATLAGLSPRAILDRGYSITRTIPAAAIIRSADAVDVGQDVEVLLARGALTCDVKEKRDNGQEVL
jgi:exodeoxyribonuclease VII large subunit